MGKKLLQTANNSTQIFRISQERQIMSVKLVSFRLAKIDGERRRAQGRQLRK